MFLERDKRGRLQQVRKHKDKEKSDRLKPTRTVLDPQIWIDHGETRLPLVTGFSDLGKGNSHSASKNARLTDRSRGPPPNSTSLPDRSRRPPVANNRIHIVDTASAADRYLPKKDPGNYPLDEEPGIPPPAPDPPRVPRRLKNRRVPEPPHGLERPRNPPTPDAGNYPPVRELESPEPAPDPPRGTQRQKNRPATDSPHNVRRPANPPVPGAGERPADREPAPVPPRKARRPARPPNSDPVYHPPDRKEALSPTAPGPPRRARRPARPPSPHPTHHPPDREEELRPRAPTPSRGTRRPTKSPTSNTPRNKQRPARTPSSKTAAYRGPPQRFDVERVITRDPEDLFAEASREISLNTGTPYPCTEADLEICGGDSRRTSRKRDHAQLRAMWFAQPNKGLAVSIKTAARDIFLHNTLSERTGSRSRIVSGNEREATHRLRAMMEKACRDSWGPELAVKAFCDLDAVFFRGKLRGHVCVTWADVGEFPDGNVFGHTVFLGRGKAVIQLNARFLFFDWGYRDGRVFAQMLATVLHEMV